MSRLPLVAIPLLSNIEREREDDERDKEEYERDREDDEMDREDDERFSLPFYLCDKSSTVRRVSRTVPKEERIEQPLSNAHEN